MSKALRLTILGLAGMLFWAAPAAATTMLYVPLDTLYERSDLVIRGTIVSHETFWGEGGQMFTDWVVGIDEVLMGDPRGAVTIRQAGGELDGYMLHIPGDAVLEEGEHVVLFLREDEGVYYLTALGQAKLTVSLQGDLGLPGGTINLPAGQEVAPVQATLVRDLSDIVFYDNGGAAPMLYSIPEAEVLTLDALREMAPTEGGINP